MAWLGTAVEPIRDRYDGEKRNPWNEVECGSNLARSMATYSLLNAFSGFRFDIELGMVGFPPVMLWDEGFRCFWSLDSRWGEFAMGPEQIEICGLRDVLGLRLLVLPGPAEGCVQGVRIENSCVAFTQHGREISLANTTLIEIEQTMRVTLQQ